MIVNCWISRGYLTILNDINNLNTTLCDNKVWCFSILEVVTGRNGQCNLITYITSDSFRLNHITVFVNVLNDVKNGLRYYFWVISVVFIRDHINCSNRLISIDDPTWYISAINVISTWNIDINLVTSMARNFISLHNLTIFINVINCC